MYNPNYLPKNNPLAFPPSWGCRSIPSPSPSGPKIIPHYCWKHCWYEPTFRSRTKSWISKKPSWSANIQVALRWSFSRLRFRFRARARAHINNELLQFFNEVLITWKGSQLFTNPLRHFCRIRITPPLKKSFIDHQNCTPIGSMTQASVNMDSSKFANGRKGTGIVIYYKFQQKSEETTNKSPKKKT